MKRRTGCDCALEFLELFDAVSDSVRYALKEVRSDAAAVGDRAGLAAVMQRYSRMRMLKEGDPSSGYEFNGYVYTESALKHGWGAVSSRILSARARPGYDKDLIRVVYILDPLNVWELPHLDKFVRAVVVVSTRVVLSDEVLKQYKKTLPDIKILKAESSCLLQLPDTWHDLPTIKADFHFANMREEGVSRWRRDAGDASGVIISRRESFLRGELVK